MPLYVAQMEMRKSVDQSSFPWLVVVGGRCVDAGTQSRMNCIVEDYNASDFQIWQ